MPVLKQDTNGLILTWQDIILKTLATQDKAKQCIELHQICQLHGFNAPLDNFRVYIRNAVLKGRLIKIKYPKEKSYYALPEWMDGHNIKEQYKPF